MPRPPNIPQRKPQPSGKVSPVQQPDVATLFKQGLALHQQGKLAQAKAIYEQVLAKNPQHFDALHLLGVIAAQKLIGPPQKATGTTNNQKFIIHRHDALKHMHSYITGGIDIKSTDVLMATPRVSFNYVFCFLIVKNHKLKDQLSTFYSRLKILVMHKITAIYLSEKRRTIKNIIR